jgi:hypothetical protein
MSVWRKNDRTAAGTFWHLFRLMVNHDPFWNEFSSLACGLGHPCNDFGDCGISSHLLERGMATIRGARCRAASRD